MMMSECQHLQKELRSWRFASGVKAALFQCIDCGARLPGAVKMREQLPPGDEVAHARYEQMRAVRRLEEDLQQKEEREAYFQAERAYWEYPEFLASDEWKMMRALVLDRDKKTCQCCLSKPAEVVHHRTYQFGFAAPAFALISVCRRCHKRLHDGWKEIHPSRAKRK